MMITASVFAMKVSLARYVMHMVSVSNLEAYGKEGDTWQLMNLE